MKRSNKGYRLGLMPPDISKDDIKEALHEWWEEIHPDPAPKCDCGPEKGEYCDRCYPHKPIPPLKAQVAKALGNTLGFRDNTWVILGESIHFQKDVPPYDEDRDLAIGALEEYCEKHRLAPKMMKDPEIMRNPEGKWWVHFLDTSINTWNKSLARAICEAIAKHSEQQ